MRVTIDLMKKSTQIIDLSNVINPRVGDDDLLLPLHICYGDNLYDMRENDVEFLTQDTNKNNIYIAGTCNTNTPGDNLYTGDLTFRFPAGTFKVDGTYDPDQTMFRIVDKATQKVISSVNVKITVMKNAIEFNFDPDKSSYDSRAETMLQDFHDKGQAMLDEITGLNNQAKSNVSGDTAATANEAKQQANANAGDISDLKGEVAGARGRFADLPGREDAQDTAISQKETIVNANANYAALQQKDAQQDAALNQKAGKFELEDKLSRMELHPEYFTSESELKSKYPNGAEGLKVTVDTMHKWLYLNGAWADEGPYTFNDLSPKDKAVMYSQSSDNVLINPDLQNSAYGWSFTGPWQADKSHAIGNSMAYELNLTEDQSSAYTFYQRDINVEKQATVSAGIRVLIVNMVGVQFQLLFRDNNGNIIDGSLSNINLPADTNNHFNIVKFEGVKVPANAATAALTVAAAHKGQLIICRPQLNFQATLVPYSIQDVDKAYQAYRQSSDNVLINPDFKNSAYGWVLTGPWQVDKSYAIGNSMAYGLNLTEDPSSVCNVYQRDIDVENQATVSAGIKVLIINMVGVQSQLLFRDNNGNIITTDVYTQSLPSDTANTFQTVSFLNVKVPANAATAALAVVASHKGQLIVCRPQLNFSDHLIPYSFSDVETEKANHILPYFDFKTDVSSITNDWVNTSFAYNTDNRKITGYAQIAIQGDSSRTYPKKNYKIKLFSDSDYKNKLKLCLKPSWPATNGFTLKANWIDATQSRNLASAKLIADATAITPFADKGVETNLAKTSNFGQMEGFPIEVYLNGTYNGLYTCNTKKDDKVLGLDANAAGNAAIAVLDNVAQSDTQLLKISTAKLDNVAYDDELHDTPDPELVANWSKWLDFLNNSSDDDFKANLSSYIDINSAINLYLFGVLSREYDYFTKSVLYLTWNNGKYFYLVPYDLDSNWGQSSHGQIEGNPTDDTFWGFATETSTKTDGRFVSNANWNKLFERMYKLFMPEIKEQYTYLRSNVWRTDQLLNAYRDFMNSIPEEAYERDRTLWNQIPSQSTNTYEQLHQVIVQRSNQMDNWIKTK
ncbi:hypothetical protein HC010_07575 [Limosilactobacillus fermentum]